MVDDYIQSLIDTSKKLSTLGQDENAALQEVAILFMGYKKIDGSSIVEISQNDISSVPLNELSSKEVCSFFKDEDLKIGAFNDKQQALILFYVESEEYFDSVPIFLQNYLAKGLFPAVFCFLMEKVDIDGLNGEGRQRYTVLPYFPLLDLSSERPNPTIGFVGSDNRLKARENPELATIDAMSNIHTYMPLIPALMMKEV